MKYIIFTLILFFTTLLASHAQIVILDHLGQEVTNKVITIQATPSQEVATVNLYISNGGDEAIQVAVKKTEEDVARGMTQNFCWNGNCFAEKTAADDFVGNPLELTPGTITSDRTLYAELWSAGRQGMSSVNYRFVDLMGNSEPVNVTVVFNVAEVETAVIQNTTSGSMLMDASPNPARGFTLIPYSIPTSTNNATIVIRNLLGNVVTTLNIDTSLQGIRVDTGGFSNGIYIYSLLIDNKPQVSKRLVVSN